MKINEAIYNECDVVINATNITLIDRPNYFELYLSHNDEGYKYGVSYWYKEGGVGYPICRRDKAYKTEEECVNALFEHLKNGEQDKDRYKFFCDAERKYKEIKWESRQLTLF